MKIISLVLVICIASPESVFAEKSETQESTKIVKRKSLQDLKIELAAVSTPEKKFYAQTRIVSEYSSKKLADTELSEARVAAQDLLLAAASFEKNWNYGNAIHHAHLVLGRIHLAEGNIEQAKTELLLAGKVSGSPQLDSFGPNMTLAKELLEKDEITIVLEYLTDCEKFWNGRLAHPELAKWRVNIKKGKIPDFKGNLVY
jgi:hypothetical protein